MDIGFTTAGRTFCLVDPKRWRSSEFSASLLVFAGNWYEQPRQSDVLLVTGAGGLRPWLLRCREADIETNALTNLASVDLCYLYF